jgi:hypothetical protein
MAAAAKKKKKSAARKYSDKTIKILFTLSGNQCAHPDCTNPIVAAATKYSDALVVGHIAHIYAASDDGPRGNAKLSDSDRKKPENLLLLCPTHHVVVDGQYETYPASLLFTWKAKHERKYQQQLGGTIKDLGFSELEVAAKALMTATVVDSDSGLKRIPPEKKIKKNCLNATTQMLLKMGAAKSAEVEQVLVKASQLDDGFPDRLRAGFVTQYAAYVAEGLKGDDLFFAMREWSAGTGKDPAREAAGLCVLSHLFIICDVFEK